MTDSSRRPAFYGRAAALHDLHAHTTAIRDSGRGRLITLDGPRQVGKSRLLTEFTERARLPYLYYTAPSTEIPARHMHAWPLAAVHSTRPLPDAETRFAQPPRNWPDTFERLASTCRDVPSVVVLDNVATARAAEPDLDDILLTHWQRHLRGCPVLLVVIGPRGGATATGKPPTDWYPMTLQPLNPAECGHALGTRTEAVTAFDTYLITGGRPRLVAGCAEVGNPGDYVRAQLLDENSDLVVMGERFVSGELAESASARLVLSTIAAEAVTFTSFSRIVAQLPTTGVTAQTATTRALKLLTDQQIVSAHVPVGAPANTKSRRYAVADSYVRFWHFFVQPQFEQIARGCPDIAIDAFDAAWSHWRSIAITPVVYESLRRLTMTMPEFTRAENVGGWWNREGHEYDLVVSAKRAQPVLAVGGVKWSDDETFTATDEARLDEARAVVPNASG
ncbi:MAG: ATP-binding protein, partial [Mycobacterium sp.]